MRLIVKLSERKENAKAQVSFCFNVKNKKLSDFILDETLIHIKN